MSDTDEYWCLIEKSYECGSAYGSPSVRCSHYSSKEKAQKALRKIYVNDCAEYFCEIEEKKEESEQTTDTRKEIEARFEAMNDEDLEKEYKRLQRLHEKCFCWTSYEIKPLKIVE